MRLPFDTKFKHFTRLKFLLDCGREVSLEGCCIIPSPQVSAKAVRAGNTKGRPSPLRNCAQNCAQYRVSRSATRESVGAIV